MTESRRHQHNMSLVATFAILVLAILLIALLYVLITRTHIKFVCLRLFGWKILEEDEEDRLIIDHHQSTTITSTTVLSETKELTSGCEATIDMSTSYLDDDNDNRIPIENIRRPSIGTISSDDDECYEEQQRLIDDDYGRQLQHANSTDSLDSCSSSTFGSRMVGGITTIDQQIPRLMTRINYDKSTQLLHVHIEQLCDATHYRGDIWLVLFLLPHPKPLWRTQLRSSQTNPVQFFEHYQQCIRSKDILKIALFCQLYNREHADIVELIGQCRIRLKDLVHLHETNILWLTLLPSNQENAKDIIGELLFSISYMPISERLTVVVSKIRHLMINASKVLIRVYLVQTGGGRVHKKRTSMRTISVDNDATFNESMIFNLAQAKCDKAYLRLSVVRLLDDNTDDEDRQTIGHVTIGSKLSDKQLGHWRKMLEQPTKPIAMWHSIVAKR